MSDKGMYTQNGVSITRNVNKKQTKLFDDLQAADEYARAIRSYSYPVFRKGICISYGVPK